MVFIVVCEFLILHDWLYINNSNLYIINISRVIEFLFYSIFLKGVLNNIRFRKVAISLTAVTLICTFINMAFIQGFLNLNSITIIMQFAVVIVIVCLYFYELMKTIETERSIITLPAFWLNTGALFFFLFNFLCFTSFAYMAYKGNYRYLLLFNVISNMANVILYSCLSICFLCFNKSTRSFRFT